ncbi:MAG: hypothetical protein R3A78_08045 [Polyangiales bacterium]|nr:hypothetical protein [Myxococcales bacterium]
MQKSHFSSVTAGLALAVGLLSLASSATAQSVLFHEDWESGTGEWVVALNSGAMASLQSDSAPACSSMFARETIKYSGGRVFTDDGIAVTGSTQYCLGAWVRTTAGGLPFVGVNVADINGNTTGMQHWLIGQSGYNTQYGPGDKVTAIIDDGDWHWLTKSFTTAGATQFLTVIFEHWSASASGTAGEFDDIMLVAGACPAAPPNSHTECDGATDMCNSSTGTCVECLGQGDCSGSTPVCDSGECVGCAGDSDCDFDEGLTVCAGSGACVECDTGKTDACTGNTSVCFDQECVVCSASDDSACTGTTPICDTGSNTCEGCDSDSDCAGFAGTPACAGTGACVECTASNITACAGPNPSCNVATNTCEGGVVVMDAGTDGGDDAGAGDGGPVTGDDGGPGTDDDGGTKKPDAGSTGGALSGGGCSCRTTQGAEGNVLPFLALGLFWLARGRKRR